MCVEACLIICGLFGSLKNSKSSGRNLAMTFWHCANRAANVISSFLYGSLASNLEVLEGMSYIPDSLHHLNVSTHQAAITSLLSPFPELFNGAVYFKVSHLLVLLILFSQQRQFYEVCFIVEQIISLAFGTMLFFFEMTSFCTFKHGTLKDIITARLVTMMLQIKGVGIC